MIGEPGILCLVVALLLVLVGNPALACTWAAFASKKAALVARTMDWSCSDNAVVKGHGRGARVKAADSPNGLEYAAGYASLQIHCFDHGCIAEGMNEKGLQGSLLYLEDSILPPPDPGRKDVDTQKFLSYAVDNFATVRETIDSLRQINLVSQVFSLPLPDGKKLEFHGANCPCHFALADAGGDKAIIEFIKGELKVYHGREHDALTNEPPYEIHLTFDSLRYQPNGTISTVDRRARARSHLRDMHERGVATQQRALLAMRGLLASVSAGTEEIDRADNSVYPTRWTLLADQNSGTYYLSRYDSWCAEIYDFSMFDGDRPEAVILKAADCPYARLEERFIEKYPGRL